MKIPLQFIYSIRPHRFFLMASLVFGCVFLFVTPPLQVPDEPAHFYRTWQIAEGRFISIKKDRRVGGDLPVSLGKAVRPFGSLIWNDKRKLEDIDTDTLFKLQLQSEEREFYDFNNTALYPPVCYMPGALTIFAMRCLNVPPLYSFYFARLASLLCWIFLVYTAIRIIPIYKWLFTFLALLPMSVFVNMSLSADVMTNAITFLLVAYILKLAFEEKSIGTKQLALLGLMVFGIASVKPGYAIILLLLFIIPHHKFGNRPNYLLKLGSLLLFAFMIMICWNRMQNHLYITYDEYDHDYKDHIALVPGADLQKQKQLFLNDPISSFMLINRSITEAKETYLQGYVGNLGWLNIPLPLWFVCLTYLVIITIIVLDGNTLYKICAWQRSVLLLCAYILLCLTLLSQMLIWNPVGMECIKSLQGRYLTPVFPLFFLAFHFNYKPKKAVGLLVMCFSLLSLMYCTWILYARYIAR